MSQPIDPNTREKVIAVLKATANAIVWDLCKACGGECDHWELRNYVADCADPFHCYDPPCTQKQWEDLWWGITHADRLHLLAQAIPVQTYTL